MESLQHPLWKIEEIRHQLKIVDGKACPDKVITNATYLHSVFKNGYKGIFGFPKTELFMPDLNSHLQPMGRK